MNVIKAGSPRRQKTYFPILCMLSSVFLVISMLLSFRLVTIGSFIAPGGVITFVLTYAIADIIAEVYGYDYAKQLILGNFICIFVFNFLTYFFIQIPPLFPGTPDLPYQRIFNKGLLVSLAFGSAFYLSDIHNIYCINKMRSFFRGKYFWLRSILSMMIGQTAFTLVASSILYLSKFGSYWGVLHQCFSTCILKFIIILFLSYPIALIVVLLKKAEKLDNFSIVDEEIFLGSRRANQLT